MINGSRHSCLFMGHHRPTSTANNLPPSKPHIRATEHFWKLTQRELFIRIRLGRAPEFYTYETEKSSARRHARMNRPASWGSIAPIPAAPLSLPLLTCDL